METLSNNRKVCLIDDDRTCIFILKHLINRLKLSESILIYDNGAKAEKGLRSILNEPQKFPDVIFLDLNMPEMDGWEFLDEIASWKNKAIKELKIYILSSSVDPSDLKRASDHPYVTGYLTKPANAQALSEVLANN